MVMPDFSDALLPKLESVLTEEVRACGAAPPVGPSPR